MYSELDALLNHMERFNEINKSDIPILIELIKDLKKSEKLAWDLISKKYPELKTNEE
jgi:hypothetical protein